MGKHGEGRRPFKAYLTPDARDFLRARAKRDGGTSNDALHKIVDAAMQDAEAAQAQPAAPPTPGAGLCAHDSVEIAADFGRLTDGARGPVVGYHLDLRARCVACGEPFRFVAPAGLSLDGPTASLDGLTLRVPTRPASAYAAGEPGEA